MRYINTGSYPPKSRSNLYIRKPHFYIYEAHRIIVAVRPFSSSYPTFSGLLRRDKLAYI